MKRLVVFGASLLALVVVLAPVCADDDATELTQLLQDFLAGASVGDIAAHERFWADDLVYTSSAGERFGKAKILTELRADQNEAGAGQDAPATRYSGEDVSVRLYGDTAVVAFRLLGALQDGSGQVNQYYNTGTFRKQDGEWQAVAWQATRIPPADIAAAGNAALQSQVMATERAFAQTMADRDPVAFAGYLAEETVFFDGKTPMVGADAVATAWQPYFDGPDAPFAWEPELVVVLESGALALSSGPVFTPDGQRVATFNSIWRREPSGDWRIVFDKGARDCPPPAAAEN